LTQKERNIQNINSQRAIVEVFKGQRLTSLLSLLFASEYKKYSIKGVAIISDWEM